MSRNKIFAISAVLAAVVAVSAPATATPIYPCLGVSSCSVNGTTYKETGGSSGDGLIFLASFMTANQSNSTIATDVNQFLAADGFTGVLYLGRQDGTGLVGNDKIKTSSSDGGLTGTWSFTPGTTTANYIGSFVAIHAGGGQSGEQLYEMTTAGLSGTWSTMSKYGLSNFDLFGQDPPPANVPEPVTLSLFGAGLAGALALRRRKKAAA